MQKLLFLTSLFLVNLTGTNLHFSLYKKTTDSGPTLLIIGGIHGNEPGGYFAPALLQNHYQITHGNIWIIPNLNFDSIVKNERGIYNDMNRKFAKIDGNDPDFQIVREIQELIVNQDVNLVLNLHDGHGFYRKQTINDLYNPQAWGQACIIDQKMIPNVEFGNLSEIAERVSKESNIGLCEDVHEFNVKNTQTKDLDTVMQQSLTYFAIQNSKPAFAIETSKNINNLDLKVYYQLKSIEEFMKIMGIQFTRDFELNRENVKSILQDYGMLQIPKGHISLVLNDLKPLLDYFPLSKRLEYSSDNPLVALVNDKNCIKIMNGNIVVTKLKPQYYEFDSSLYDVHILVDGEKKTQRMGDIVDVKENFEVFAKEGYRVNIIGFNHPESDIETGISITKKDIEKRFSIDKQERIYRIEFYKDEKFCGMILARFNK
ncbi:M99 family carboxypeptidase catalytic domain-containing protein [Sulfuricurvum sp.]|uniref:M99 family carboxypeptidase catalytic domain-containing protein n=1 Tax=Sulfuricurvum sp. TaxID=2025608 RepID=UPI00263319D8|nr:M99 family carboxypeptidase catalytic domain-containing protein [Sulfuricurvum sp.]MDD3596539.1 M99 family carboxypeptidase catalytic domain-containing protein [Sulfuricurvum sp.]